MLRYSAPEAHQCLGPPDAPVSIAGSVDLIAAEVAMISVVRHAACSGGRLDEEWLAGVY